MTTATGTAQRQVSQGSHFKSILVIIRKLLRDSRKALIWTGIGVGLYTAMILAFYPSVASQGDEFQELIDSYPEEMIAAMYSGDMNDFKIADPAIFLQIETVIWIILILGAVITVQAFNGTLNAERDNKMDLMLSLPISRHELILARMLHTALTVIIGLLALFVPVVLIQPAIDGFYIAPGDLAIGLTGAFILLMVQSGLSYSLATFAPSHSRWAGAIAFAYFYGAYLMMAFTQTVDLIDRISPLFIFKYFNMAETINQGIDGSDWLILGTVALVLHGVAFWRFQHKELGV